MTSNTDTSNTDVTSSGEELRPISVRRTFLIQRIQEWNVEIPAAYDTDEWKVNDLSGFDEYVFNNGEMISEDYDHVECDDLELDVLDQVLAGPAQAERDAEAQIVALSARLARVEAVLASPTTAFNALTGRDREVVDVADLRAALAASPAGEEA